MNKPIGGFFELEKTGQGGNFPQQDGVMLNTGRNALEYILSSIGNVKKIYIPYYTCNVILEPLNKLNIDYSMYSINEKLEITNDISLLDNEYLLYTNYFGVKDEYVRTLSREFGEALIVDCAQALYASPLVNVNTIYSPRKFVGIPDGGIAFCSKGLNLDDYPIDDSSDRMSHLFLRLEKGPQAGYPDFKTNSLKLIMQPVKRMSLETRSMINSIDFEEIKDIRKRNFQLLHKALSSTNQLQIPDIESFECPMVYPYWTSDEKLRTKLIEEQIFVATYWPNVMECLQPEKLEFQLAKNIIPLPIDQRYGDEEMERIIELVCK